MRHVEQVIFHFLPLLVPYRGDVAVDGRRSRGVFKQDLRNTLDTVEILVYVDIIKPVLLVAEPHGEINHHPSCGGVIDCFRCPSTTYLCKFLGHLVETYVGACPMDEVERFHQHQATVVSPTISFPVALPFRIAVTLALCINMQVGHGQVEAAVRATVDMRVADTFLVGDCIACNNGLAVVQGGKRITVAADGCMQAVVFVLMEYHKVGRHVFFLRCGVTVGEVAESSTSFSCGQECRTEGIEPTVVVVMKSRHVDIRGQFLP